MYPSEGPNGKPHIHVPASGSPSQSKSNSISKRMRNKQSRLSDGSTSSRKSSRRTNSATSPPSSSSGSTASTETDSSSSKSVQAPIHKLPPEMLAEIFLYMLSPLPSVNNRAQAPLLLTRVCSQWRLVALQTPSLWSTIDIPFARTARPTKASIVSLCDRVRLWLDRSGTLPLSICFAGLELGSGIPGNRSLSEDEVYLQKQVFLTTLSFSQRWETVQFPPAFSVRDYETSIALILAPQRFPALRSVFMPHSVFNVLRPLLDFPCLRAIKLLDDATRHSHQGFDNLVDLPKDTQWEHLQFLNLRCDNEYSALDHCRRFPNLVALVIKWDVGRTGVSFHERVVPMAVMPHLKRLTVIAEETSVRRFFRYLQIPVVEGIIHTTEGLVAPYPWRYVGRSSSTHIALALASLMPNTPMESLREVTMETHEEHTADNIQSYFKKHPSLRIVHLVDCSKGGNVFDDVLSDLSGESNLALKGLLPALEELWIENCARIPSYAILRFLRPRFPFDRRQPGRTETSTFERFRVRFRRGTVMGQAEKREMAAFKMQVERNNDGKFDIEFAADTQAPLI